VKEYIFFWGCTIPNRLPFIEKSMRMVLEVLGVPFREVEGFTCCPEKYLVETMSEETWYFTAARNLALAEREGADLLVACNGCYSTFRSAISAFNRSSSLREKISMKLSEIGLEFNFRSSVKHVVEVLYSQIGCEVIERKVKSPLYEMRLAAHYGCQILKPSPVVRVDDPLRPVKLDRIIEACGAQSVDYNTKLLCCGEALARSGMPDESLSAARLKLLELDQLGADGIVVMCPACFLQFETQQNLIQRQKEDLHIPVFYFTEIISLALGLDPREMGLDMHRISVQRFFDRWREKEALRASLPDVFDYELMRVCTSCESCANDCPVAQVDETFHPHDVLRQILNGSLEDVIKGDEIWKCLECGTCVELCPNNFGMMKVFKEAKRLAIRKGNVPAETVQAYKMFKDLGVLGKVRGRAREKLGLEPILTTGIDELSKLIEGEGEE